MSSNALPNPPPSDAAPFASVSASVAAPAPAGPPVSAVLGAGVAGGIALALLSKPAPAAAPVPEAVASNGAASYTSKRVSETFAAPVIYYQPNVSLSFCCVTMPSIGTEVGHSSRKLLVLSHCKHHAGL